MPAEAEEQQACNKDACAEAENLMRWREIWASKAQIQTWPEFSGYGIVDQCFGDMLVGAALWEVKSVRLGLEIGHLRQVLTYCALAYAANGPSIEMVGFVNPYLAEAALLPTDQLANELSGLTAEELYEEILALMQPDLQSI